MVLHPETYLGETAATSSRDRIDELRDLARSIANDEGTDAALRLIAESIRTVTGGIAVAIERYAEADSPNVAIAWVGPVIASAADLNAEVEHADRVVISLGRRNERLGAIVVWRDEGAPPVEADEVERLGDLANMAALALRRMLLEEQIRKLREEQDRIIETKFRLINGISEELKNRMGVAGEYVQLLDTEGELTELEQRYIAGSRRSIDAAVHLVNELVQLARAETGRLALCREPINIGSVLRGSVRDYELTVGTIGVEFQLLLPDNLPIIETDVDQVRQILDNLLGNAVRYTPVGGLITVRADVRPGRRKTDPSKYVCLSISDTGPGIGDHDMIFEEVYRVERRGGTPGFRLAISRRIARLLGGELTLETQADAGSTFTLWLPGNAPEAAAT
jgi:two-component system phosphate regulon sensor histidine kinase PhoR